MQRLVPEHFERPDDVIVGAAVGVLPDFVYQVRSVVIVVQDVDRFPGAGQSTGFKAGQNRIAADAVKLLSDCGLDVPLVAQVFVELSNLVQLITNGLHECVDDGFVFKLLHKIIPELLDVINHP